ncbi:MAG: NADH-quinone oxidoreductase subunit C [Bacteroidales bacterium]|nr:NADH-quinone oxidoreductase subunit C [Bacteroidales bacterium]
MEIQNGQSVSMSQLEVLPYNTFYSDIIGLMEEPTAHCVNYFAVPRDERLTLICCIAVNASHSIHVLRSEVGRDDKLLPLTNMHRAFHVFEREIHELYGLQFQDHPWLKPLRYAHDRANDASIYDYPFFNIQSEEFHRVGVGPIHAGIIEPGHFRFICEGEKIHHLEIQLGWQHRGIERLFVEKQKLLQRATLAENIAGDTVVGHSTAFCQAYESLAGYQLPEKLAFDRTIALEQERIAIHTGDLSAICTDIAYQLGNAVFGRLRTPMINFFQQWCGNRFAKSLIRPGKTNFPFTPQLADTWRNTIAKYKPHFIEMGEHMFDLPSVLSRIERTGIVPTTTARSLGLVGMAAKASGIEADIRASHPYLRYNELNIKPIVKTSGDVFARARVRYEEVLASIQNIERLIDLMPAADYQPQTELPLRPGMLTVSLVEGWRGEICHCAVTGAGGQLTAYKIVDPSVHNWMGLAMAVRNNGISDFPICNKSFDLSYCGHDL